MTNLRASGIDPGQRRLNGPQTTGRQYRNLSQPTYAMTPDDDVPVPMRDGIELLADVHRPTEAGHYPVLIAASPYPRQMQDLGAREAGAVDVQACQHWYELAEHHPPLIPIAAPALAAGGNAPLGCC